MKPRENTKQSNRHSIRLLKLLSRNRKQGFSFQLIDNKLTISISDKTYRFDSTLIDDLSRQGYIEISNQKMFLSKLGFEKLKLILNPDLKGCSNTVRTQVKINDEKQVVELNQTESPLYRLYTRKNKNGVSYITHDEFQAGERLRRDFERGQLQPRISANLSVAMGTRNPSVVSEVSDFAIDARKCVHKALDSLGPELSGVTLDICCFLKGLELVERERKWPPRSAKLMLKTGLAILARHYGITSYEAAPRKKAYFWGAQDFRPELA